MAAAGATQASLVVSALRSLSDPKNRRLLLLVALGGGGTAAVALAQLRELQQRRLEAKASQAVLATEPESGKKRAKPPAVDAHFLRRLQFVLRIVVPSWHCQESFILCTQSLMLVARSLLSMRMARLGGEGLKAVVNKSWPQFRSGLLDFFMTGTCAALVNSAIKFLNNSTSVAFRRRLTLYVHQRYLANRNYYRAAVLRLGNLDNADQRIVEDLNQWCVTIADLYSRTFKPALDVILSTRRMGQVRVSAPPGSIRRILTASRRAHASLSVRPWATAACCPCTPTSLPQGQLCACSLRPSPS
jgi:hypothetical protein